VNKVLPSAFSSPGLTGEKVHFAFAEIDETLPENAEPVPDFDDTECIETLAVSRETLFEFLVERADAGDMLDSKVLSFALGLNFYSSAADIRERR
jgi:hypothetical protein